MKGKLKVKGVLCVCVCLFFVCLFFVFLLNINSVYFIFISNRLCDFFSDCISILLLSEFNWVFGLKFFFSYYWDFYYYYYDINSCNFIYKDILFSSVILQFNYSPSYDFVIIGYIFFFGLIAGWPSRNRHRCYAP